MVLDAVTGNPIFDLVGFDNGFNLLEVAVPILGVKVFGKPDGQAKFTDFVAARARELALLEGVKVGTAQYNDEDERQVQSAF